MILGTNTVVREDGKPVPCSVQLVMDGFVDECPIRQISAFYNTIIAIMVRRYYYAAPLSAILNKNVPSSYEYWQVRMQLNELWICLVSFFHYVKSRFNEWINLTSLGSWCMFSVFSTTAAAGSYFLLLPMGKCRVFHRVSTVAAVLYLSREAKPWGLSRITIKLKSHSPCTYLDIEYTSLNWFLAELRIWYYCTVAIRPVAPCLQLTTGFYSSWF